MAISYEQMSKVRSMSNSSVNGLKKPRSGGRRAVVKRSKSAKDQKYIDDDVDEFDSPFEIEVRFMGGISSSQELVFEQAAQRWAQIIVSELPPIQLPTGEIVENLLIDAQGVPIDGVGGILGRAGPQFLRPGSLLPAKGMMQFDTADMANMEANGSLLDVITHEMGHVLGIGTLWGPKDLLFGCETPVIANPVFLGPSAIEEFAALVDGTERPVPVANTGGPGTKCGHWRESVFGNELMTGFINNGLNPISRLTIASLEDLGYEVNKLAADPYVLPSQLEMALMGIGAEGHVQTCQMCGGGMRPVTPVVLPESSLR